MKCTTNYAGFSQYCIELRNRTSPLRLLIYYLTPSPLTIVRKCSNYTRKIAASWSLGQNHARVRQPSRAADCVLPRPPRVVDARVPNYTHKTIFLYILTSRRACQRRILLLTFIYEYIYIIFFCMPKNGCKPIIVIYCYCYVRIDDHFIPTYFVWLTLRRHIFRETISVCKIHAIYPQDDSLQIKYRKKESSVLQFLYKRRGLPTVHKTGRRSPAANKHNGSREILNPLVGHSNPRKKQTAAPQTLGTTIAIDSQRK